MIHAHRDESELGLAALILASQSHRVLENALGVEDRRESVTAAETHRCRTSRTSRETNAVAVRPD
jgi:hypothetical protein